jgi:hypothetical protein
MSRTGREGVRDAQSPLLPADELANPALDLDVPACRASHPGWEARGTREIGAAEALHVEDRRDAVLGTVHRLRLDAALESGHLRRE